MRRLVKDDDFKGIYEIFMEPSINRYMSFEIIEKHEFNPIFDELRSHPSALYAFEESNQIIGVCAVIRKQRRQSHVAYLGSLAFSTESQGKGLAKKYIGELIQDLKNEGFKRIELIVEADNPRAIAFYEKCGFKREGVMRGFLKRKNDTHFTDDIYMGLFFD